jgi:hypothetical protein
MNSSKRMVIALLGTALIVFAALLFWPFLLDNIIKPTGLAVWLLLRILVLSIDQKFFWYASAFAAVVFLFRFLLQEQTTTQANPYPETNTTIQNIRYWRIMFTYNDHNIRDEKTIRRELLELLTCFYVSKQSMSNHFGIHAALQQGEIPLPEHIRAFLFPEEPSGPDGSIKKFLQSVRKTPWTWVWRWTGQEKAEHYQMIDEVLNFMETALEGNNDERAFKQNQY